MRPWHGDGDVGTRPIVRLQGHLHCPSRPRSHPEAIRAADGNGVPSSRAMVRSSASSIARPAGGSSWRSQARWPYLVPTG